MILYECTNGQVGESYVRVYVWARNDTVAEELAKLKFKTCNYASSKVEVRYLFSNLAESFISEPSDSGFSKDLECVD